LTETTDTKEYAEMVRLSTAAAAIMAPDEGDDFLLCHFVDGSLTAADAFAASLKLFRFRGIVALIDGVVVCKPEPGNEVLGIRAAEHFTRRLESLPAGELFRLDLERIGRLEDPRP
jgi:hypothetical protein